MTPNKENNKTERCKDYRATAIPKWVESGTHYEWNSYQHCLKMPAVHSGREHEWSKLGCSYGCRADFINDQAQLQGLGVGGCCTAEYSRHGSREELQRERKQECAAIDGYTECWVKHRKLGYQVNLILVLIPEELIFNSRTNYLQKLSSALFPP